MRKLLMSLLFGMGAGIVDVVPMVLQGLDGYSCSSAFLFWCVQGVVVSYVEMPLSAWLKGVVVAELSALPILAMVAGNDPGAMAPIVAMTAGLGAAVGAATGRYARAK